MPEKKRNCRIVSVADAPVMTASSGCLDPSRAYRASVWQPDINPLVWPDQEDIREGSIAFHTICGDIAWKSWWRFSTDEFIAGLKAADANPAIAAHLIRVDSGGGEVFGCHEAFEAVRGLSKPCIAAVDSMCASAAYWLACAADRIYATSMFSETGCIGVMGVLFDDSEWMEKNGFNKVVLYSSLSDLKNKPERDALAGHPEEFISSLIDPIAAQFIADVKSARSISEDSEALRGKMYFATEARDEGLIDGWLPLEDCLDVLADMIARQKADTTHDIDINDLNINL